MSYNTKVYKDKGGDRQVHEVGSELKFGNVVFTVNAAGNLVVTGLPTTEPATVGAMWSNNGVLTVSDGP